MPDDGYTRKMSCAVNLISTFLFLFQIDMEYKKKYSTLGTIPKSNIKMLERGKFNTSNTQIRDRPLSRLGTLQLSI